MYTVKLLPTFANWLSKIADASVQRRLARRLEKAQLGNLGETKSVSEGVFEMREFFGSGWRMYYVQRGETLIVMLGGGNKATQKTDVAAAIALSKTL